MTVKSYGGVLQNLLKQKVAAARRSLYVIQ